VIDGYDESGNIKVRDPLGRIFGSRYKIKQSDFFKFWNGTIVRLSDEQR